MKVLRHICTLLFCLALLGPLHASAAGNQVYPDVPVDHWAEGVIAKAGEFGLIQGREDGTFGLGRSLSRAEFVTILSRMFGWDGHDMGQTYADVTPDKWYYGVVEMAAAAGVSPAGETFRPEAPITRAETATILFRLLTDDSRAAFWAQSNPYYDVYEEQWFNNAISTLSNAGILRGYPDNTFRPNAFITRAEFAVMLSRFYDVMDEAEGRRFTDVAGHWAEPEIYQAAARELIEGYPEGDFRPNQLIDRAEAMTMINRLVGRQPRKEHLLHNMIEWPDNMDTTRWYYAQVQEATNGHDYTRANDANGSFEIWQSLAPIRDWAALEQSWSDAYSAGTVGEVITSRNAAYSR